MNKSNTESVPDPTFFARGWLRQTTPGGGGGEVGALIVAPEGGGNLIGIL